VSSGVNGFRFSISAIFGNPGPPASPILACWGGILAILAILFDPRSSAQICGAPLLFRSPDHARSPDHPIYSPCLRRRFGCNRRATERAKDNRYPFGDLLEPRDSPAAAAFALARSPGVVVRMSRWLMSINFGERTSAWLHACWLNVLKYDFGFTHTFPQPGSFALCTVFPGG
jgi:hypothetical protein